MIIDLTHTIAPDIPVYPGTPAPALTSVCTLSRNGYRESALQLSSHTGTHMDAPAHLLPDGSGLDQLPVSQFCGRAIVLDVSGFAPGENITADYLKAQNGHLRRADFALLYTGWEKRWGTEAYFEDTFPVPDEAAARYLVSCGLKGIGIDALSVDRLASPDFPVHKALLSGGLVTVENLCLKKLVGREDVMFFALPLKYQNADGAPVRAIAEFRDFSEEESERK
jgi:kynurenine formamidase